MEAQPKFIKDYSKETAQARRDELAKEISEKRTLQRKEKSELVVDLPRLRAESAEYGEKTRETLARLVRLGKELDDISATWKSRLKNFFRRRALLAEIHEGSLTYRELDKGSRAVEENLRAKEAVEKRMLITPKAGEEELATFYGKMRKEWAETPYTNEDLEENFSEENLASLSLPDYIDLLKRFPTKMVAHVTRQGIRDHVGHGFHTAGQGEYATGFMDIAKDGRLRSPLSVFLARGKMKEGLEHFLALEKLGTREEALDSLKRMTDPSDPSEPGSFADRMAIHFATEEVADSYYGSEKGNEVFMVFPSAQIASQYHFAGQLTMGGGGFWNDQFVWANEEKGMNINTGIVFLPGEVRVGRETGSLYKLDEKKNPIINQAFISEVMKFAENPDFESFATEAMKVTGKLNIDEIQSIKDLPNSVLPFRERLENEFGIKDEGLILALLDYRSLSDFVLPKSVQREGRTLPLDYMKEKVEQALKSRGIYFEKADDTVPAKEYWEEWFKKNPGAKPSKIVYYTDPDPTTAFRSWRKGVGLQRGYGESDKGEDFLQNTEKKVSKGSPEATMGIDRFRSLAIEIINEYFDKKEVIQQVY